jgi:UTP--glucose-1-phosphate uridylyltransferase
MLESMCLLARFMPIVEDALIVAGGLGTRMYPVSAFSSKESLPLIDVPVLIHLAHEAKAAGVKRIHIISSPSKDLSPLLRDIQDLHSNRPELDKNLFSSFSDVEVKVHLQQQQLGLGDAISCALDDISGPFLVLLGDNVILDNHASTKNFIPSNASKLLVQCFEENNLPCGTILPVNDDEVSNYGVVQLEGNYVRNVVEKPKLEDAPSNLVLCGRYLFTSDAKDLLRNVYTVEKFGELQSIELQKYWMHGVGFIGVQLEGFSWYDSGNPYSWLQAQVDHALQRPDIADKFRDWLESRLN